MPLVALLFFFSFFNFDYYVVGLFYNYFVLLKILIVGIFI